MKHLSKFFPKNPFLLIASIGAGLLLAACSGNAEPATATKAPPTSSAEISTAPVEPADSAADPSPEPTAGTTAIEATASAPEATTATNPTGTTEPYPTRKPASAYADLQVVTLLPPDAIPAINNPQFLSAEEADQFYDPDELIMGVSFNGDSRAYSAPFLSNHEIVNDTVGGVKLAVTW